MDTVSGSDLREGVAIFRAHSTPLCIQIQAAGIRTRVMTVAKTTPKPRVR